MGSKTRLSLAGILVALAFALSNFGCGGGQAASLPITVMLSPATATVDSSGIQQFTATVTNDPTNKGVTWTISPASGAGTLSNMTSTSATYTAPASPASTLSVTITATAVADTTKSASATIAVTPIAVTVSPSTATVQAGSTQQFTATVSNDPKKSGVNWSVSCSTAPCGTVSPSTTGSGAATTYTAPSTTPLSGLAVTLTASSVALPLASASATIAIPGVTVSVTPSQANLQAGATQQFKATVTNDPTNSGVIWSVSCSATACGSVSPTTTASGSATTYTAPSTPPIGGLIVTLTASSVSLPSASASATVATPGVTVAVNPAGPVTLLGVTVSVEAGTTQQFIATVTDDPTDSGVNWSVSCSATACGSISPTTTASGSPTTYTAPVTPPPKELFVTVTATSVTLSAASASATVTVPAITVSVSPISALLPGGTAQPFTAKVGNDPTKSGVTWALTENGATCAATACGTLNSTTANPVNYGAPAMVSAAATVTLTATSVTDTTKSASSMINLTFGTVALVPDSVNFGNVVKHQTSAPQTVTVTNTANTTLSITGITITGADATEFAQKNNCGTGIAAGNFCTITVTLTPAQISTRTATVSISDTSPDSPQQVSLSGSGTRCPGCFDKLRTGLANTKRVDVPSPTGRNAVGTRVMELIDSSRADPYLADGAKRDLLVRFWYPASLNKGCTPASYTSPAVWRYFSKLLGIPLPEVQTNACQDAPIEDGFHPVVVFTPGYTATFTDYTFIFEDLASRGYVVASVDHTYEAAAVEFPDGRLVQSVFGSVFGDRLRGSRQDFTFAVEVRLRDLEFVVNELERQNGEPGSPFEGKLDTTRIALAGHSLGGLTAILGVEQEPRFRAGINMDGGVPDGLAGPTDTPVLILAAGREEWSENDRHLWDKLRGARFAVNLKGAEHVTPSDALWLAPGEIKTGTMGLEKTTAAIREYLAAFLDTYLRGESTSPLLTGPSPDYPDASVTLEKQWLGDKP
jgi:dienelactone hydrolase